MRRAESSFATVSCEMALVEPMIKNRSCEASGVGIGVEARTVSLEAISPGLGPTCSSLFSPFSPTESSIFALSKASLTTAGTSPALANLLKCCKSTPPSPGRILLTILIKN